jgi:hypothetical protein
VIAQGRDSWIYDDFEQFLLDSARRDQAPTDLPERLGVTLGLTIPVVLAAELAPTLLSSGAPAPIAIEATKSATFWASGTLWTTAVKGMAIGLLAGASAIAAGEVAVAMTDSRPPSVQVKESSSRPSQPRRHPARQQPASNPPLSALTLHPTSEDPGATPPLGDALPSGAREERSTVREAPEASGRLAQVPRGSDSPPDAPAPAPLELSAASAPVGIAAFEVVTDETKPVSPAPEAQDEANVVTPEGYRKLRAKTITHVRALLGRNQASEAIHMLDRFRARVGASRFGVEELLLRIEALVSLGRSNEALRTADLIARLAPNSAELRRARLMAGSRHVR